MLIAEEGRRDGTTHVVDTEVMVVLPCVDQAAAGRLQEART